MINHSSIIFFITITVFIFYSYKKNRIVTTSQEFSLSGRDLSGSKVAFIIIGTLVGGASTIGTSQLAYEYGAPSLIFTFSSSIACLILGIFFSKKLRESETITVTEIIGNHFGDRIKKYLGFFALSGLILQTVAQFMAASSIIISNFSISNSYAVFFTGIFIIFFILLFGSKGASFLGKYKLYMLYLIGILSIINIFINIGDLKNINPFKNYGIKRGFIDTFSTIIGVISTQTYLQAIFSAKDVKSARNGAFISAALIPPIGIMFYLIGIYMNKAYPHIKSTATVLPSFIYNHFDPFTSSIFLAFLFIISVGTASGLFLGTLTMLFEDYLKTFFRLKNIMLSYRLAGLILIAIPIILTLSDLKSGILEWSYMSMGLRGASIFLPLLFVIFNIKQYKLVNKLLYFIPLGYILFIIFR